MFSTRYSSTCSIVGWFIENIVPRVGAFVGVSSVVDRAVQKFIQPFWSSISGWNDNFRVFHSLLNRLMEKKIIEKKIQTIFIVGSFHAEFLFWIWLLTPAILSLTSEKSAIWHCCHSRVGFNVGGAWTHPANCVPKIQLLVILALWVHIGSFWPGQFFVTDFLAFNDNER